MFGRRMTKAMVDWRKQHPQQITTTIGTLGGLIGEICCGDKVKSVYFRRRFKARVKGNVEPNKGQNKKKLTLKLFFTSKTTNVPDIGQIQRVMFSIRFSVMQTSVRQLGSNEAFESYLNSKSE